MTSKFLYKQVIVVREDLKMSPGKLAVQVAHASVGAYRETAVKLLDFDPAYITAENWFTEGFRKIVLKVKSEKDILDLKERCHKENISHFLVYDFGLTELDPNTLTCIGIGPDLNENIDKITGRLGLYK
jgi:PTH2 family peptidyl-tRNA hydrolase